MAKYLDRLKKHFNITTTTINNKKQIHPARYNGNKSQPVKFPSNLQSYLDWYINNCFEHYNSVTKKEERYKDLLFMEKNSAIIQYSVDLYSNEATQADVNFQLLQVNSKNKKMSKEIYELFETWGINQQVLNDVARNLALFGDSYWINNIDEKKGVVGITPLDVFDIVERISYNPAEVVEQMQVHSGKVYDMCGRSDKLKRLADELGEVNNASKYYKEYLFGYELKAGFVLPWDVTHFRLYTTKSEFRPYGRSLFINAISPYRQLQAAQNLMTLARANKFPKEVFYVKDHEGATEADQWQRVNEARQEYKNLSISETDIEAGAISEQYFLPDGIMRFEMVDNNMRLNDILDIELLEQNLMRASGVPLDYMYSQGGGFTSGIALSMQSKPFARRVFFIQTAILKELTQLIRIHFTILGKYENENFELYMNFPNAEDSRDKQSVKSDSLRLAKDIVDSLGQSLGLERDDALPVDVVRDIFSKYTFMSPDEINSWIDQYSKEQEEKNKENEEFLEKRNTRLEIFKSTLRENFNKFYLDSKERLNLKEGVEGMTHYFSSTNVGEDDRHVLNLLRNESKKIKG